MTGFLGGPLKTLNRKDLARVIRAILDRHPIIVSSNFEEGSDYVVESLVNLIPHRREVVFGSDFFSPSEHEQMIRYEQNDYNGERMTYRAPSSTSSSITGQISNFKGWIIATTQDNYDEILKTLKSCTQIFLVLKIHQDALSLESNGIHKKSSKTSFEQKLLDKVMSETETRMERITRVLRRAAQGKISQRLEKSLIDLHHEEERVRQSLFRDNISAFVEAAWRALVILMRLRLLDEVGVTSIISNKMLSQSIDYKSASINRLIQFIHAEWGEDFRNAVQGGRGRSFGDRLEGFWTG